VVKNKIQQSISFHACIMWYGGSDDENDVESGVLNTGLQQLSTTDIPEIPSPDVSVLGMQTHDFSVFCGCVHSPICTLHSNFSLVSGVAWSRSLTPAMSPVASKGCLTSALEMTPVVEMTPALEITPVLETSPVPVERGLTPTPEMTPVSGVVGTHNDPEALLDAVHEMVLKLNSYCLMGTRCFPPGKHVDGSKCLGKFSLVSEECDATCLGEPTKYLKRVGTRDKGWGVIALSKLEARQVVCEYTGRSVAHERFAKWKQDDPRHDYVVELQNKQGYVQPLVRDEGNRWYLPASHFAGHMNHSCKNANCMLLEAKTNGDKTRVYVCTTEEIRKRQELTLNYGWKPQPCFCGSCC